MGLPLYWDNVHKIISIYLHNFLKISPLPDIFSKILLVFPNCFLIFSIIRRKITKHRINKFHLTQIFLTFPIYMFPPKLLQNVHIILQCFKFLDFFFQNFHKTASNCYHIFFIFVKMFLKSLRITEYFTNFVFDPICP